MRKVKKSSISRQNLKSGTHNTANVLTKAEILEIISSCAKANISHFKYGGLELSFSGNEQANRTQEPNLQPTKPDGAALPVQHEEQDKEYLASEEMRLKEERLAMMLIENPLEAEKLIMNGDAEIDLEGDNDYDE